MAAKRGNVKLFLFLLENNVDINSLDFLNRKAIDLAI